MAKKIPDHNNYAIVFPEESLTKQSFRDECNINNIVNRFTNTGQLPTSNKGEPHYDFAPNIEFKEALDLTKKLHSEFNNLTAEEREQFDNNPTQYAEFLSLYAEAPESFINVISPEPDTVVSKTPSKAKDEPAEPLNEV